MSGRIMRLEKQIREISIHPIQGILLQEVTSDVRNFVAYIIGPKQTPYQGGIFKLKIHIPQDHPFRPPLFKFLTKVWHPNIDPESGDISMDILHDEWCPQLTIQKLLLSIQSLLDDPNPDQSLNVVAAVQYKNNRQTYYQTIKKYVRQDKAIHSSGLAQLIHTYIGQRVVRQSQPTQSMNKLSVSLIRAGFRSLAAKVSELLNLQ